MGQALVCTLGPCGAPWALVAAPGPLWASLGPCGPHWALAGQAVPLGPYGTPWTLVGSPGPLWVPLDPCVLVGQALVGWAVSGPSGPSWAGPSCALLEYISHIYIYIYIP